MVFPDHVYIDVFGKSGCGSRVGLVSGQVHSMMSVEILRFVDGFVKD